MVKKAEKGDTALKSLTQNLKKPKASIAINILLKRVNGYEK